MDPERSVPDTRPASPLERETMASVLIVDDDADLAGAVADVLRSEGHEVRVARDGEDGYVMLCAQPPDLLVLDIEMPVLDGPGMAYRLLLHDAGLERIPILVLSGALALKETAGGIGTPYFLPKPCRLESLLALVDRALAERAPPAPDLDRIGARR
jgi:DNA-binding response OmpR family regulator